MSLNGTWEFSESKSFNEIPEDFKSSVPVPGLIDMASPAPDTSYNNKVYWYKKTFKIEGEIPDVTMLKIYKAMYHTKVFLNKKYVGEYLYCFTPSNFDVKSFLNPKGIDNELVIGIGCYSNLPDTVINGVDLERRNYIPGIYDNVELQLTGYPYISNIQIIPNIDEQKARVNAIFNMGGKNDDFTLHYSIREVSTGKTVIKGDTTVSGNNIDFNIPVKWCTLWSPENPFMYELYLGSGSDDKRVKFGMRSFSIDKERSIALLNGKPYYLRGTNICFGRFIEDPQRTDLPWDNNWVIRLYSKFKGMHWNSMRNVIGFPPERWYEIADSIGFLVQDEYPVWWGPWGMDTNKIQVSNIAKEYTEWMRERWNHPCVVIWDAQNESKSAKLGKAIQVVRNLDLSNRPWDNGWSPPQSETDIVETHPYLMDFLTHENKNSVKAPWTDIYTKIRIPHNGPSERTPLPNGKKYPNAIIINEYEWLWLNRDGSTTTLTDSLYPEFFGKNLTKEQRYEIWAKILAMDTEYWRAHRKCAGVQYFCGLSYSRSNNPRGQTCDNFIDIKNLVFEPNFERLMKPAFAPVGLMLDIWHIKYKKNTDLSVPVFIINDTYLDFNDTIKISLVQDGKLYKEILQPVNLKALVCDSIKIQFKLPYVAGKCKLTALIKYAGEQVTSEREFDIVP